VNIDFVESIVWGGLVGTSSRDRAYINDSA
jgi:hypothetical protein